jgi:hypothetical protein
MKRFAFVAFAFAVVSAACSSAPSDPTSTDEAELSTSCCGPQLGLMNYLCPDGKTMAGPGACIHAPNGTCHWNIVTCPAADAGATSSSGAAGDVCGPSSPCGAGLLCCYSCGTPPFEGHTCPNRCYAPMRGHCPLFP